MKYDFMTGQYITRRKVQIPLKQKLEKSIHAQVFEKQGSLGFGRSRGVCQKSIDKKSTLVDFLRDGNPGIVKEAD